jgi:hypothetical protein
VGEAGRYSRGFFFGFTEEDGELLYRGHGDIPAIVTGQKGLYELLVSCPTGIDQQLQKTQLSELSDQQDPRTLPFKSRKKRADAMTCQWGGRRRRCKELGIEAIIWSWGRGGETTTAHAAPYCDMINARVDWLGGDQRTRELEMKLRGIQNINQFGRNTSQTAKRASRPQFWWSRTTHPKKD